MNNHARIQKKDIFLLIITLTVFAVLLVFCLWNWHLIVELFRYIVTGKELVQDYILSFGVPAQLAIGLITLICFFFPFFSLLPLEIVCGMTYGIWHATLLISLAIALASQLLYLVEHNFKVFLFTDKQRKKQAQIEECIRSSKRSIHWVMILLYIVPCIPFLIISSVACRSNMKWGTYTLYTALGPAPEVLVTLILGDRLTTSASPAVSFAVLMFMIALVVLSLVFRDSLIRFIFRSPEEE